MGQSSIIIHKGGREAKYEIYVEDYVISFLKEETGTLELSEFYFYGYREKGGRKYVIYGAGRDSRLAVFDKYSLLEEIGCRLTQAGPVFLVSEEKDTYEVKGYNIFYQDNGEMQNYLIDQKSGIEGNDRTGQRETMGRSARRGTYADGNARTGGSRCTDKNRYADGSGYRGRNRYIDGSLQADGNTYADDNGQTGKSQRTEWDRQRSTESKPLSGMIPHSTISLQLGIILVALVAIVINSTDSYDKMRQLNRSASEVFFTIENQEAEDVAAADGGRDEITVERDMTQEDDMQEELLLEHAESDAGQEEDILKLVTLENEGKTGDNDEEAEAQEMTDDVSEGVGTDGAGENGTNMVATPESSARISTDGAATPKAADTGEMTGDAQRESSEEDTEQEESGNDSSDEEEVEALSRNVARYYKVERGDTLYMISKKIYGDTSHVQKICELNQITDPDNIRYGQKIILP